MIEEAYFTYLLVEVEVSKIEGRERERVAGGLEIWAQWNNNSHLFTSLCHQQTQTILSFLFLHLLLTLFVYAYPRSEFWNACKISAYILLLHSSKLTIFFTSFPRISLVRTMHIIMPLLLISIFIFSRLPNPTKQKKFFFFFFYSNGILENAKENTKANAFKLPKRTLKLWFLIISFPLFVGLCF